MWEPAVKVHPTTAVVLGKLWKLTSPGLLMLPNFDFIVWGSYSIGLVYQPLHDRVVFCGIHEACRRCDRVCDAEVPCVIDVRVGVSTADWLTPDFAVRSALVCRRIADYVFLTQYPLAFQPFCLSTALLSTSSMLRIVRGLAVGIGWRVLHIGGNPSAVCRPCCSLWDHLDTLLHLVRAVHGTVKYSAYLLLRCSVKSGPLCHSRSTVRHSPLRSCHLPSPRLHPNHYPYRLAEQ